MFTLGANTILVRSELTYGTRETGHPDKIVRDHGRRRLYGSVLTVEAALDKGDSHE
jgi:hypothetical protein